MNLLDLRRRIEGLEACAWDVIESGYERARQDVAEGGRGLLDDTKPGAVWVIAKLVLDFIDEAVAAATAGEWWITPEGRRVKITPARVGYYEDTEGGSRYHISAVVPSDQPSDDPEWCARNKKAFREHRERSFEEFAAFWKDVEALHRVHVAVNAATSTTEYDDLLEIEHEAVDKLLGQLGIARRT